jgi:hypothetical protein
MIFAHAAALDPTPAAGVRFGRHYPPEDHQGRNNPAGTVPEHGVSALPSLKPERKTGRGVQPPLFIDPVIFIIIE